jgi:hypothetical protein
VKDLFLLDWPLRPVTRKSALSSVHPHDGPEIIGGLLAIVLYNQATSNQLFTYCGVPVMPTVEKFFDGDMPTEVTHLYLLQPPQRTEGGDFSNQFVG